MLEDLDKSKTEIDNKEKLPPSVESMNIRRRGAARMYMVGNQQDVKPAVFENTFKKAPPPPSGSRKNLPKIPARPKKVLPRNGHNNARKPLPVKVRIKKSASSGTKKGSSKKIEVGVIKTHPPKQRNKSIREAREKRRDRDHGFRMKSKETSAGNNNVMKKRKLESSNTSRNGNGNKHPRGSKKKKKEEKKLGTFGLTNLGNLFDKVIDLTFGDDGGPPRSDTKPKGPRPQAKMGNKFYLVGRRVTLPGKKKKNDANNTRSDFDEVNNPFARGSKIKSKSSGRYTTTINFDNGYYEGQVKKIPGARANSVKIVLDGKGKYYFTDGGIYEGRFKNNVKEGKGKFFYPEGAVYTGMFVKNLSHGPGTYKFASGSKYVGSFVQGVFEGKGKMYYKNNKVKYDGRWYHNKKHGFGKYYYEDGAAYFGEFVMGKRQGLGIMLWPTGGEFIGWWKNNKKQRDFLLFMVEGCGLEKIYFTKCQTRGFQLSMLRRTSKEDLDQLLETIFEEHKEKVLKFLEKYKKYILSILHHIPDDWDFNPPE